jgi:hypothetical protein
MNDEKCIINFSMKPEGKCHLEGLGINGTMMLILKKYVVRVRTGYIRVRRGISGGLLKI